jgi:hypothetical protein
VVTHVILWRVGIAREGRARGRVRNVLVAHNVKVAALVGLVCAAGASRRKRARVKAAKSRVDDGGIALSRVGPRTATLLDVAGSEDDLAGLVGPLARRQSGQRRGGGRVRKAHGV